MATNKFATMLHKNSHKIIVVLVYAILEWILILLLLLNSLFSYFIQKFAKHFGLKPPCTWCSRIDRVLESKNDEKSHHDHHVCATHGAEISNLSYCSAHHRLAESNNLCADCSSSRGETRNEVASIVGFFTRVSENIVDDDQMESVVKCSCCDELFSSKNVYPPSVIFKDSWDFLDYIQKKASLVELIDEENIVESLDTTSQSKSISQDDQLNYKMKFEEKIRDEGTFVHENEKDHSDVSSEGEYGEDFSLNFLSDAKFQDWKSNQTDVYRSTDDPFLSLESSGNDESLYLTETLLQNENYMDSDKFICIEIIDSAPISLQKPLDHGLEDNEGKHVLLVEEAKGISGEDELRAADNGARNGEYGLLESQEMYIATEVAFGIPGSDKDNVEASEIEELDKIPDLVQKDFHMVSTETIPDQDGTNRAVESTVRTHCSGTGLYDTDNFHTEVSDQHHESNDQGEKLEEEKQHANLIMFEKRESVIDYSLDGCIISEMEIDNENLTTDQLKVALKAQRKALIALYAELEEERKAAAIAAQETMSMITKIQEEKSSMQMEAVQYQRMMEEQTEYDQEALQLLNDLMIKREKEKQELEKELEIYRKKVLDYEAREKMTTVRSRMGSFKSTNSSDSFDPNCEGENNDISIVNGHQESMCNNYSPEFNKNLDETGVDSIAQLTISDISLAEFDEERLCILQELQALEAKLFSESSAKDFDRMYDPHSPKEAFSITSKKLLPLFDATDHNEGGFDKEETSNHSTGTVNRCLNVVELETDKAFIEEELVNMHERLQALEADKEFLKHCIGSMMKGDKGLVLVQEILQHLRDLRSVELSYNRCITEQKMSDSL